MRIRKMSLYSGLLALVAVVCSDLPRRDVPVFWESGLVAKGRSQFSIRREGDITLKYVTASLSAEDLDLVPVPYYQAHGPATESVREIARRFSRETRSTVIAAINGGFFDPSTGLPIGFLLRDRRMEFFNMPQGFIRSMVGFSPFGEGDSWSRVHISSPRQMPKVWLDTLFKRQGMPLRMMKVPLHHINVPGGKNALGMFTPTFGHALRVPAQAIYLTARPVAQRPGVYEVVERTLSGDIQIPPQGIVITFHGNSRSLASAFPRGALVRPGWSMPAEWAHREVTHGLLAGPRLLEQGSVQVTARQERLDQLKSRDRVALGVKPNGETVLLWAHKNTAGNLSFEQAALKALKTQGRASNALRLLYRTLEIEPNNPQGLLILSELFRGRPNGNRPSGDDIYSGIIIEYALDPKTSLTVAHKPTFERERTVIMAAWGFASQRGTEIDLDHIGYMTFINGLMAQVGSVYKGFMIALTKLGIQAGTIEAASGKRTRVYEEWLRSSNANLQI